MVKSFIILFREGFETFLILFIVLGVLRKAGRTGYNRTVYLAAGCAVVASIILAMIFRAMKVNFEGATEEIFEGLTMIITSVLLAVMILWLIRFKVNSAKIKSEVLENTRSNNSVGIFLLIFFSVFREGLETVLFFLVPDEHVNIANFFAGGALGLASSLALCYLIFKGTVKLNFAIFFNITSALLLIIAAGLMAHGVHELQEAKWLPKLGQAWDLNPPVSADGTIPLFHENGLIGAFFKSLLGYNGSPDILEVITYLGYILTIALLWRWFSKNASSQKSLSSS